MKIDFAVVCDYALIDQFGKLSVLGIFQHIWVAQFPTVHPRLHLVVRMKGKRTEIGEHRLDIRVTDAAGAETLSGTGMITFNEPPAGVLEIEAGTVLAFDVPFDHEGRYQFEISVDGTLDTVVPIVVGTASNRPSAPRPDLN
ncbi:MAG TPA: hypothetical protein VGA37_07870 [Gemmatimonadales bacterium]